VVPSDCSYDNDLTASSDSADGCSDPEFDPDGEVFNDDDEYDPPPFHMMSIIQLLMYVLYSQMWIGANLQ